MNCIILQDDGQLLYDDHPVQTDPLVYLGFQVKLAPACTLRSFFRCMHHYEVLTSLNPFLTSFLEYYAQCNSEGCLSDGFDRLALWRHVEIIGHPGPPRMELSVSLDGFSGQEHCDIRHYWFESLLDMPLELGHLSHVVFGDTMDSMQFETVFNLFELIDGVCWQLSFHNHPAACQLNF